MSVPAPDLSKKSIPQLLQALSAGVAGSPMHQQASIMLQYRVAEKQTEAAVAQTTATDQLVTATRDLAGFTHALVRATYGLFVVGGAALLLTIVQVLIAVKVIGR